MYVDTYIYIYIYIYYIVFRRSVDSQSPMSSPPSPSWEVSADDAPRWHWGRPGPLERCVAEELPAHGYMDTTITKTIAATLSGWFSMG